jgi:hypothetical protein
VSWCLGAHWNRTGIKKSAIYGGRPRRGPTQEKPANCGEMPPGTKKPCTISPARSKLSNRLERKGGFLAMRFIGLLALILLAVSPARGAPEFGSKAEAVAMVKRVQDMFKKDGAKATFKAVSDKSTKEFHDRDLYPFVYNMKGVCVAHGARPALIGKNLIDLKDQDGKYLIREMIKLSESSGSGWVDYKWPNPITNKIEDKSSYIEKMGNYFVGVGIYKQ